jgi:hypothetical protein
MPTLIGLGAGAGATMVAVALGFAFWPPSDQPSVPAKATVSQPVFVAGASQAKSAAAPVAATATAAAGTDSGALAKLAIALKSDPSVAAGARAGATRSLAPAEAAAPVSEAARRLCAQGLVALAAGDIAGARLYLERAAEAGDARALMALGASYDPASLARMGARGLKGDAATARVYYARALAAGMGAARERMAALDGP